MILFKDDRLNQFYIKDDKLYVDIIALGITRLIGKVNYNLDTGDCTLVVNKNSSEQWKFGYLVSAAVFDHFSMDKVVIIEDGKKIYILDWKLVKDQEKSWRFNPSNGFEDQIILPISKFSYAGEIGQVILS